MEKLICKIDEVITELKEKKSETNLFIVDYAYSESRIEKLVSEIAKINNEILGISRPIEASYLILKYPYGEGYKKYRERFFDSPNYISRHYGEFIGCFCIFLSLKINSKEWRELEDYIEENKKNIRFIFVPLEIDKEDYEMMFNRLSKVINLKIYDISDETKKSLFNSINKELNDLGFTLSYEIKMELFLDIEKILSMTRLTDIEIKEKLINSFNTVFSSNNRQVCTLNKVRKHYSYLFSDTEQQTYYF